MLVLILVHSALATELDYSFCTGKSGAPMELCKQGVQLDAARRAIDALQARCAQACDNSAPATASAPRSTGPSQIRLDVNELQTRIAALESRIANDVVSKAEYDMEIGFLEQGIKNSFEDYENRLSELERKAAEAERKAADAEPPLVTPPLFVPGPVPQDPQGPAGIIGEKGAKTPDEAAAHEKSEPDPDEKDPLSWDFSILGGVSGASSHRYSLFGVQAGFRLGGRTGRVSVGIAGSGFAAGHDDLGFEIGGYFGVDVAPWLSIVSSGGWRESAFDIRRDGARRVFAGPEGIVAFEVRPFLGRWVVFGITGGGFVPRYEPVAFSWGVYAGAHCF